MPFWGSKIKLKWKLQVVNLRVIYMAFSNLLVCSYWSCAFHENYYDIRIPVIKSCKNSNIIAMSLMVAAANEIILFVLFKFVVHIFYTVIHILKLNLDCWLWITAPVMHAIPVKYTINASLSASKIQIIHFYITDRTGFTTNTDWPVRWLWLTILKIKDI